MSDRIVVRFSCGAASAVAAKLTVQKYPDAEIVIANAYIQQEHPDNRRFLADCEKWLDRPISVLRDAKYDASTYEVFRRSRFMKNRFTAPCSHALKRNVLAQVAQPGDVSVIGYTAEERARAERLDGMFPLESFEFPLIDRELTKADCLGIIERAGIQLPEMYRLGYSNANCIGCVKGGEGYWNNIRRDFPEQFEEIACIQDELGPGSYLFRDRKTGERYSLRDLPPNRGRYSDEPDFSCGFFCQLVEIELAGGEA